VVKIGVRVRVRDLFKGGVWVKVIARNRVKVVNRV
jgi:hypothetical protein